jgi:hypothetical protein
MKDKTDPSEGAANDCEIEELKGGKEEYASVLACRVRRDMCIRSG